MTESKFGAIRSTPVWEHPCRYVPSLKTNNQYEAVHWPNVFKVDSPVHYGCWKPHKFENPISVKFKMTNSGSKVQM